jgi:hypothetical protein
MKPLKYLFILLLITAVACKKQPGQGGTSTIQGKLLERKMSPAFTICYGQYNAADFNVFIVYGDGTSPDNNVNTGTDGHFEFPYLRKGNYKIYAYGNDSAKTVGHLDHYDSITHNWVWNPLPDPNAPKAAVIKEVEITKNHQILDAGTLVIYN